MRGKVQKMMERRHNVTFNLLRKSEGKKNDVPNSRRTPRVRYNLRACAIEQFYVWLVVRICIKITRGLPYPCAESYSSMAYVECGVTDFSTCSFQFYDLYLREVGGQTVRDDGKEAPAFGGGYHYKEYAQLMSSCRNRSIVWCAFSSFALVIFSLEMV